MEDQAIIDLFWDRDERALTCAQSKYGNRLYKTAQNILHNDEDASECLNDTLLKAWGAIPPARPAFLGAFLSKVVRNLALNRIAARHTQKRGDGKVDLLLSELEDCLPAKSDTEAQVESAFVVQSINDCLEALDPSARILFIDRYFHGESIQTLSEKMNLSENTVKSTLFRTRKKLKLHLEKEGIVI